ncbi:MAG: tetratricopeptide repeat protein [Nitrospirae bacterium]|nr:tetratricopeptide repeat protein [Nitrospirota bacterium]
MYKSPHDKTIADYNKAVESAPDDPASYLNRGIQYLSEGKNDQATVDFTKAIEIDPQSAEAYFNRGVGNELAGRHESAFADYAAAARLGDHRAQVALHDMGYLNSTEIDTLNNSSAGMESSDSGENGNNSHVFPCTSEDYFLRGFVNGSNRDFVAAVDAFTKCIDSEPNSTFGRASYNYRALAYLQLGDFDRAIHDANKAIELDQKDHNGYYYRGIAHRGKEEYDKAIVDFTQVIALCPGYTLGYFSRGLTHYARGANYHVFGLSDLAKKDYDMAISDYKIAARHGMSYARQFLREKGHQW